MKHLDRKSTRLNSSHLVISYAVFCLKKKISSALMLTYSCGMITSQNAEFSHDPLAKRLVIQGKIRRDQMPIRIRLPNHFFFNDTAPPEIYPLSLHDALPIYIEGAEPRAIVGAAATIASSRPVLAICA